MNRTYDYAIVGAGPAGLVFLEKIEGNRIALIEQCKIPRKKLCGGVLKQEVLKLLPDIPDRVFVEPRKLNLVYVDIDNGVTFESDKTYFNVNREEFDFWLFQRVKKKYDLFENVIFRQMVPEGNFYVLHLFDRVEKKQFTIRARTVIGADGAHSNVRRQLLGRTCKYYIGLQIQIEKKCPHNTFYFIFDSSISVFYSWIIPKNSSTLVGSAFLPNENPRERIPSIFKRFRFILGDVNNISSFKSSPLVRGFPEDVYLGKDNVLLIGEAAGLVSPKSGEGISYAIKSGMLCAEILNNGGGIEGYVNSMKSLLLEMKRKHGQFSLITNKKQRYEKFKLIIGQNKEERIAHA